MTVEYISEPDDSYFADYGKAALGTLELSYSPQKAEKLIIRFGDKLLDGAIDREPGGSIFFPGIANIYLNDDYNRQIFDYKSNEEPYIELKSDINIHEEPGSDPGYYYEAPGEEGPSHSDL